MNSPRPSFLFLFLLLFGSITYAQTTAFIYQGSLNTSGTPAKGNHDFEFALFDALGGGSQIGNTLTRNNVVVTNGVFAVSLDFGSQFPGSNRFLEVRVRPAGQPGITVLSPRQQINSSPYSIRSLNADSAANATNAANAMNATQLGGVAANQYVLTGDSRMTDARSPLPGSASYIQNQNAGPQAASNFNISGNGTVGGTMSASILNAGTQFNIGGTRVFGITGASLFVGIDAGINNTSGSSNSFFGFRSGFSNSTGFQNAFFGNSAGGGNTTGRDNSFFGSASGAKSSTGSFNAFFGTLSGRENLTGSFNAFFGIESGKVNTIGNENSFFGGGSGIANTTGIRNTYLGFLAGSVTNTGNQNTAVGYRAGGGITTGSNNTFVGALAELSGSSGLSFATAIGAASTVSTSNTIVLGRSSGADTVLIPGTLNAAILSAPRLTVSANSGNILMGDAGCSPGFLAIGFVASFTACTNYSLLGNGTDTILNRPAGGRLFFRENNSTQMMLAPGGNLGLGTASPTERLHVVGNSFVTGSSTVGSSLTVNGAITFGGELSSGSNANFAGSLLAGGAINTSAHFRINGSQVLTRSRLDLFNTAAVPRGYSFEVLNSPSFLVLRNDLGTTIMTVAPDGKVGIGDNNPTEGTLEIGGTLAVSNLGGSNGEHLCRDGNVIRACSAVVANVSSEGESGSARIASLESTIRLQQAEIERQRNELAALKNFICFQNPTAEICGPKL